MKLEIKEYQELKRLAQWFSIDIETLLHKLIQHEIWVCNEIRLECSQEGCTVKKYELASQLKLLE